MRRRFSWSVVGTSGVLAAVTATMIISQAGESRQTAIVVPQVESTRVVVPRPLSVDVPGVPPTTSATSEIVTPPTTEVPRQPVVAKPKATPKTTEAPPPPPPPPPPPAPTSTVTPPPTSEPAYETPWYFGYGYPWYGYYQKCDRRCR